MAHKLDPLVFDPYTGLPQLPEGLAWDVSKAGNRSEVWVAIHEKITETPTFFGRIWGDKPLTYWQFSRQFRYTNSYREATEEAIKNASVRIYNEARQNQLDDSEVDKLVGLYPPNSLSI